jgi:F0F1-type ATP synthase delta subunit
MERVCRDATRLRGDRAMARDIEEINKTVEEFNKRFLQDLEQFLNDPNISAEDKQKLLDQNREFLKQYSNKGMRQ